MDKQEEEGFYSPEGFPSLHVTRQEICMGNARFSVRINQIKSNPPFQAILHNRFDEARQR
jgi:hypothetical protein